MDSFAFDSSITMNEHIKNTSDIQSSLWWNEMTGNFRHVHLGDIYPPSIAPIFCPKPSSTQTWLLKWLVGVIPGTPGTCSLCLGRCTRERLLDCSGALQAALNHRLSAQDITNSFTGIVHTLSRTSPPSFGPTLRCLNQIRQNMLLCLLKPSPSALQPPPAI